MAVDLQLDGLTVAQKVQLLEGVREEFGHRSGNVHSPEWHAAILEQRKRKLQDGTMPVSSWSEAKDRLLKLGK